jgi:quercetin dioxygenase-like cupin family protein
VYTYPHTIENGAGGERLTFVRRIPGPAGDRLEVENRVTAGNGPPMHLHHYQEEAITVQQGRMAYQRPNEHPQFAGPGETVAFQPGEAHKFWNACTEDVVGTGYIEPADNIEYFLGAIYASQKAGGGRRPGMFDVAYLLNRYRSEFAMTEIPAPVQRLLFPVVLTIGRLLGKYKKYADAPESVKR